MRLWQGKKNSLVYFSLSLLYLYIQSDLKHTFSFICFCSYTHDIEALSCDEVLIDGSALLAELGINPEDLGTAIRADIEEKTGCCASVGMGEFMFVLNCEIDQDCVPILQTQTDCSSVQGPTSCWLGWRHVRPSQTGSTS